MIKNDGARQRMVLCVFGTRPEVIKMAPVVHELHSREGLGAITCVTAQHREMLDQALEAFDLEVDFDLDIMKHGQTLASITADVLGDLTPVLNSVAPDLVLVHGDTTTCFAAALAAFYAQIPVGHVEAGLRTSNRYSPFPEEMNRRLAGRLATVHFSPTQSTKRALVNEGIDENVAVTGNTVIDALFQLVDDDHVFEDATCRELDFEKNRVILLTAHRRENLGPHMVQILTAVRRIVETHEDVIVVYPVHKNPQVIAAANEVLGTTSRVHLIDPLDVRDMHNLMSRCFLVMTDSGGLQEEAPALGKPVVVLRRETERPEAIEAKTAVLAGVETDVIVEKTTKLLDDADEYLKMSRAANPFGDGKASARICDAIENYFATGDIFVGPHRIEEFYFAPSSEVRR